MRGFGGDTNRPPSNQIPSRGKPSAFPAPTFETTAARAEQRLAYALRKQLRKISARTLAEVRSPSIDSASFRPAAKDANACTVNVDGALTPPLKHRSSFIARASATLIEHEIPLSPRKTQRSSKQLVSLKIRLPLLAEKAGKDWRRYSRDIIRGRAEISPPTSETRARRGRRGREEDARARARVRRTSPSTAADAFCTGCTSYSRT